ncbi:MAG TPA: hypothetical protein VFT69_10580 [Pseudolabrys sp.]|nr:hypothetical protein [Pseudolabrys sp.]
MESWSALIGIWGSSYLALVDDLDIELVELGGLADTLQWPLLIVGALGTGSVLYTSWQESRPRRGGPLLPRRS